MALALLFGAHGHQPVGNFPSVLATAHERCYRPFLRTLHRFPGFCFSLHFSGCLLDYLLARHPGDMALLAEMVDRGQVELFGGGDCEPVLAAIPERDRIGQILALSEMLERRFGCRPTGAWLTERVWEPTVVPALADCGIRYVTVDDYHFLCAGKDAGDLDGFHTTEEGGRRLDIFPISEALRYRLPFSPAADAVAYLEQLAAAGRAAAIYFDDIEKLGIWRNFFTRYPESNWMHKRVLAASQRLAGLAPELRAPEMTSALYRAQGNDAYWHGLFGGIYLPHLRRARWRKHRETLRAGGHAPDRLVPASWPAGGDAADRVRRRASELRRRRWALHPRRRLDPVRIRRGSGTGRRRCDHAR